MLASLVACMSAIRIALFIHNRQNDYQTLLQSDCEQTARRLDLHVSVTSAENNAETQLRQIRAALSERESSRPRAIIVSPVSEIVLLPLIHDAAKLGIGWVFLSRWNGAIQDLRRQYPKVPILAVLPDHFAVGRIQGQQLRLLMDPGDEVVFIQGPIGVYTTKQRRAGLDRELADRLDIRRSYLNGDWSLESGENAMASWLSTFSGFKLPPFVIAAQNDSMAIGARRAVMRWSANKGKSPIGELRVLGCDGSVQFGQRLLSTGELRATVAIPPVSGRAVEEIAAALRYGRMPAAETTVPVQSLPDLAHIADSNRRHSGPPSHHSAQPQQRSAPSSHRDAQPQQPSGPPSHPDAQPQQPSTPPSHRDAQPQQPSGSPSFRVIPLLRR